MATKVICLHCDSRMAEGVAFCPTCNQPTVYATHEDRVAWEVEQWRRLKGATAPRAPVHRVSVRPAPATRRREVEAPPPPQPRPVVIPRQGPPLVQAGDLSWVRRETPPQPPAPPITLPAQPITAPTTPITTPADPVLAQIVGMLEQLDTRFTSLEERLDVVLGARASSRRTSTARTGTRRLVAESLRGLWRGPST